MTLPQSDRALAEGIAQAHGGEMNKSINEQAADILEAAAMVIQLPGWWTRHDYAKDSEGEGASWASQDACAFCALGSLHAAGASLGASHGARTTAYHALRSMTPDLIPYFNDYLARSGKQVARLMFRAADQLRSAA